MSQKGKAGRDLIQVGRDFVQTTHIQNFNTISNLKFSPSLVMFGISMISALSDVMFLKSGLPFQMVAGGASGIILVPMASFIVGFIPIVGGLGVFVFLCVSIASLQQPSMLPGFLCLLSGIMSGVSCRKSILR